MCSIIEDQHDDYELREAATGEKTLTQVSGPDMFGFSVPAIAAVLQDMPNAERCHKYTRRELVPALQAPPPERRAAAAAGAATTAGSCRSS